MSKNRVLRPVRFILKHMTGSIVACCATSMMLTLVFAPPAQGAAAQRSMGQGATTSPVVEPSATRTPNLGVGSEDLWEPPLGRPLRVSEPFRAPLHPYGPGHRGIDIPATVGAPVVAPADGVVSFEGTVVDRGVISIRINARTVLSMEPIEPLSSGDDTPAENHASTREDGSSVGDTVTKGEAVGVVSTGAHCSGSCLHLGVRVDGEYVNPMRFLLERPILLPW